MTRGEIRPHASFMWTLEPGQYTKVIGPFLILSINEKENRAVVYHYRTGVDEWADLARLFTGRAVSVESEYL